jgi:hypothetical protein
MDQGDQGDLSSQELALLRSLARRINSRIPTEQNPNPTTGPDVAEPNPIPFYQPIRATSSVTQPGPAFSPATVTPAESLPVFSAGSSQGHPSPSAMPSTQPFLGFNNLGISMTSQVNRQRLSAAAAHIPRQPRLPSRGRRRGPACHPPGLPRAPQFVDCFTTLTVNGASIPGIRITVKVYPPTVSCHYRQPHLTIY